MNKKGQVLEQLGALGAGVAVLAIVLTVTFLILAQGQDQVEQIEGATSVGNSSAWNATATLTNAVATIPGWVPLIIIAVIGSVLLGLVALFRRR